MGICLKMNKQFPLTLLIIFTLRTCAQKSDNALNKVPDSTNSNKTNNDHFEELKKEAEKFKTECKTGISGEEKTDTKHSKLNESLAQDKSGNDDNKNSQSLSTTNGGWNKNSKDESRQQPDQSSSGFNGNGYDAGKTNSYGDYSNVRRGSTYQSDYNSRSPYGYGYSTGGYYRTKRSDDIQCVSQCIFGYLEVLDDNRSPSEYALIKWLQDNLQNDTKRMKAIRDTRKCFARYAATDNDDACSFSKALSNCLNLNFED